MLASRDFGCGRCCVVVVVIVIVTLIGLSKLVLDAGEGFLNL